MKQYLDALRQVVESGVDRTGRNGNTRAVFGMQMRFDMSDGFPAVTTKQLAFNTWSESRTLGIFEELLRCQGLSEVGMQCLESECGGGLLETARAF